MTNEGQQPGGTLTSIEPERPVARRKRERRELRVAFDTNVLFNGSASDLVRQEATTLITQSKFPDLDIQWYLPEVVRLERQFQMQNGAMELLAPLARVEKLLGHNLNIIEEILIDRVEKVIAQRQNELGLILLKPEYANLDWQRLVVDAAFRRAPFRDGKTEKGFRDAMVVESFVHLVGASPKTPKVCRVVLITGDSLVTEAVRARTAGAANVDVLGSLEELRGFINTLVSEVDETFLASLRPKAQGIFFAVKDDATLYYKERVCERLTEKFVVELATIPPGATSRKNGTWRISAPNFSKKSGQRIQWTSRIDIETQALKVVRDEPRLISSEIPNVNPSWLQGAGSIGFFSPQISLNSPSAGNLLNIGNYDAKTPLLNMDVLSTLGPPERTAATHKGKDVYDVLWSVDVTRGLDLRRPSIDDIVHVDTTWEALA